MRSYFTKATLATALATSCFLTACKEDPVTPVNTTPTSYSFENVSYGGQTVRILLTDTLMTVIEGLAQPGAQAVTKAQLEAIYDNTNSYFAKYSTGKKLSDKIFGGKNGELDMQFRAWFDTLATRSQMYAGSADAVTTADGLFLPELIEKHLMGAVMYYQALNYLNNEVPTADNSNVIAGEGTKMQHNWDEAFGYFGAAKKYGEMSVDDINGLEGKDFNNDGSIDPASERNAYFARYAGRRDKNYTVFTSQPTSYAKTIFDAFVKGRNAINNKDYTARDQASAVISQTWDKIVGSSAVKYAVDVKNKISTGGYNGQWAELKMFVEMSKYNSNSLLTAQKRNEIMALIGNKPSDVDAAKIDQILSLLKGAYSF